MEKSTLKIEGPLQVSKWLKLPLLIDEEEMEDLLSSLPERAVFYPIQGIVDAGNACLSKEHFLQLYREYVQALKGGTPPNPLPPFALSQDEKALYAMEVGEGRVLVKARLPVVQIQANQVRYDGTFRTQQFGEGGITWGIQISYPQLFQDNKTHEITPVHGFANTSLFKTLQKWIRRNTRPTPFVVDGKKQNTPIRLGKACFEWIGNHPQLLAEGIQVD